MIRKYTALMLVLVLSFMLLTASCGLEDGSETAPVDFYKGKTIDLVASESPGGGNDLLTRIIASYLGEDTGASVVVTNRGGAGGLDGMNYLYKGKPDGLTMGTVSSAKFVSGKVLNEPAALYDIGEFAYIMGIDRLQSYFYVSPDGPYQTVADLQAARGLKLGGGSPAGNISLAGLTVIKILGLDAKVITGLNGESNRAMAVKRGEIAGYCLNILGTSGSVSAGMIRPMFVLATQRDPLAPDVPAVTELVKLPDEDLDLVKLWETALVSSTLLVASPGVPENRLAFIRSLADKWSEDEQFRQEVNRIVGYEVQQYMTGDKVTEDMLELVDALDRFQAIFLEMIQKYRA